MGRRTWFSVVGWSLLLGLTLTLGSTTTGLSAAGQTPPVGEKCAKTWVGHEADVEAFVRTAEIDRVEEIPIGVTKPKRAYFKGDGPAKSMAWKPLRPGIKQGFWESYKAEIAAYELDKILNMQMVAPAVERRYQGDNGAAVMWVDNVHGWKINEPIRGPDPVAWDRQVVRMKMFDLLTANTDRNQGNLLYDDDWHLILIDHSRTLTDMKDFGKISKPGRIDLELWNRMKALTLEQLQPALSAWMSKKEIEALLIRRDKMQKDIDAMVKAKGEAAVFMK